MCLKTYGNVVIKLIKDEFSLLLYVKYFYINNQ